jgi:hypothetical protein
LGRTFALGENTPDMCRCWGFLPTVLRKNYMILPYRRNMDAARKVDLLTLFIRGFFRLAFLPNNAENQFQAPR